MPVTRLLRLAILALLLVPGIAHGQLPPDIEDPLGPAQFLIGRWAGEGDGEFGTFRERLEVTPALGGRILAFRHVLIEEDGPFEIQGHLTRDRFGQWKGSWADAAGFVIFYRGRIENEKGVQALILEEVEWNGQVHIINRWTFRLGTDDILHSVREFGNPGSLDLLLRSDLTRAK